MSTDSHRTIRSTWRPTWTASAAPDSPRAAGRPRRTTQVIATTTTDLTERAAQEEFSWDLVYRLNVVHLVVPPLHDDQRDLTALFAADLLAPGSGPALGSSVARRLARQA